MTTNRLGIGGSVSARGLRAPMSGALMLTYGILIVVSAVTVLPLFWAVSTSLKPFKDVVAYPPVLWPTPPQWSNYIPVFTNWDIVTHFRNTMIIAIGSAVAHVCAGSLTAYAFSKLYCPIRNLLFGLMLATIMLPGFVTFIPVYVMFHRIGMVNSFFPFLIPPWFGGGAWNIFLLRQFFMTIPDDLIHAARVDGASEFRIFAQVAAPLAKPAMATIFLFSFMGSWNDFFGPYIYLTKRSLWPFALALHALRDELTSGVGIGVVGSMTQNIIMGASLIVALPVFLLFLFTQRFFIEGITITGMKG
jgi:multiple sugar transport system permease protein